MACYGNELTAFTLMEAQNITNIYKALAGKCIHAGFASMQNHGYHT